MEIIERKDAMAKGLPHYFTGRPCKFGHVARRRCADGRCSVCDAERMRKKWKDCPERMREISRAHYARNAEACRAVTQRWRDRNPEAAAEHRRKWRAANPHGLLGQMIRCNHGRRAAKFNAEGSFTADDVKVLRERQNGKCACCGTAGKLTIDHIVPLSKGGKNTADNLQLLCNPCNVRKGNKLPNEMEASLV